MKLEAPAVDRQKLHIRSQSIPTVGHSGRPEASRTGRSVEAVKRVRRVGNRMAFRFEP